MLKLSTLFHLNLMYSSIEEADRPEVIRCCYTPLLDLAASGLPISVEATGLTLSLIAELAPEWLARLRDLIANDQVEFIGSGWSQIIAPLVPAAVNRANLDLGQRGYAEYLDHQPTVWLVNEMAWSAGLPSLYRAAGITAAVMEWNNAWKYHPDWASAYRYHAQRAVGADGTEIPLLWIDTLDFQRFQRMAHGQLSVAELVTGWTDRSGSTDLYGSLYGSDAEVFDYRPGRYKHEGNPAERHEWQRVGSTMHALKAAPNLGLGFLRERLTEPPSSVCGIALQLESPAQPVVVKKQEKYNLTRWSVSGRGDLRANTTCHHLAASLTNNPTATDSQWRELCYLWSSDFRTHLTPRRFTGFQERLAQFSANFPAPTVAPLATVAPNSEHAVNDPANHELALATDHVSCHLDPERGLAIRALTFPILGDRPILGTLPHGHFDDIAFGADFYTGHVVVQQPGQTKQSDLQPCHPRTSVTHHDDGRISITATITTPDTQITKRYTLSPDAPMIHLQGTMVLSSRFPGQIHPIHLTFIPGLLEADTLRCVTHNGGTDDEVFALRDGNIHHGEPYSTLVTAKHGLGATQGTVIIRDDARVLTIRHTPTLSALMPTVQFSPVRGGDYFLRLRYSAQEMDETFVPDPAAWTLNWSVFISGSRV